MVPPVISAEPFVEADKKPAAGHVEYTVQEPLDCVTSENTEPFLFPEKTPPKSDTAVKEPETKIAPPPP